jgi:xanthine/CO dehydrogenase XdhC/CoxF family maturation factor
LRWQLAAEGVAPADLAAIKTTAGLDISAITSEEIALSILAESSRRGVTPNWKSQRDPHNQENIRLDRVGPSVRSACAARASRSVRLGYRL